MSTQVTRSGRLYDAPIWSRDHDTGKLTAVLCTIVWRDHERWQRRECIIPGPLAEPWGERICKGAWLAVTGTEVAVAAHQVGEGTRWAHRHVDLRDITAVRVLDEATMHMPAPKPRATVVDSGPAFPF